MVPKMSLDLVNIINDSYHSEYGEVVDIIGKISLGKLVILIQRCKSNIHAPLCKLKKTVISRPRHE